MQYGVTADLIEMVEQSVNVSRNEGGKLPIDVLMLRGFSSPKIRRFLNHVNSFGPHVYLEIGTWAGSTFIPAIFKNDIKGIAIDDYSQFGPEQCGGFDAKEELQKLLLRYGSDLGQYHLINRDCFGMTEDERPESQVFFYDGAHEEAPTQLAIWHFGKRNKQPFILVVDDWELTATVKSGTEKALEAFNVKKQWHLTKADGYHEGVAVFVLEPK